MTSTTSVSFRSTGRPRFRTLVRTTWTKPAWTVLGFSTLFLAAFSYLALSRLAKFQESAFDVGIYDQAFWLVSKGKDPLISFRGMNMWAHHTNLVAYLYAPFYWLGAGVRFLLVTQVLVVTLGALPIYRLAKKRLTSQWLSAGAAVAYLLYAPIQWLTWQTYHPETLAITPILFAVWLAEERRWKGFVIASLLALTTREEAAVALGLICIRMAIGEWSTMRRNGEALETGQPTGSDLRPTKRGVAIRAVKAPQVLVPFAMGLFALAWFLVCTKLIIPHFNNNQEPYYLRRFFGRWGTTMTSVLHAAATHPLEVARSLFSGSNIFYVTLMLFCIGGLALLSPSWLILTTPFFFWNAISMHENTRSIMCQYTIFIIPALLLASLNGLAKLSTMKSNVWKKLGITTSAISMISTALLVSLLPISLAGANEWHWIKSPAEVREALKLITKTDRVSADIYLGTHLAHRDHIYQFPNPYVPSTYGPDEKTEINPNTVTRIIVTRKFGAADSRSAETLQFLLEKGYYKIDLETQNYLVATQVKTIPVDEMQKFRQAHPFVDRDFSTKPIR